MNVETKKARLQQKIHCYEQRDRTERVGKSLKTWRKSLKLIQKGQDKAQELGKIVEKFIGQSVCSVGLLQESNKDKNVRNALGIYYKWGIENKIPQRFLLWYTGKKSSSCIYDTRKNFTKSLKISEENAILWKDFKEFVINEKNRSSV